MAFDWSRTIFSPEEHPTSWDVLERIKKLITEEPLRIRMRGFISLQGWEPDPSLSYPHCGAVGCVAAWAAIVTGRFEEASIFPGLNLSNKQVEELYYPEWYQE